MRTRISKSTEVVAIIRATTGETTATLPTSGQATILNLGSQHTTNRATPSSPLDVWVVEQGGVTRFVTQATANTATDLAIDVKGDQMFTAQIGRPGHTATITTAAHWSPTGCIFHAQAIVQ